uniref:lymphocyte function-associated antigen 3 n=1 Tax=Euleptes europaea TaxID=460621 RepID=UPI002541D6BF|nr:lymphocyte function-associated antigen 3 [Euleptes europaea]
MGLTRCLGCPQKPPVEITGIDGKGVTLAPGVNGSLTSITWKKSEDIVAEWDEHEWFAAHLEGRAELDRTSGSLTFLKLQRDDAGEYTAEALVAGEIQCTFFSLRILEPPKPPQLNCTEIGDRIWVSCEQDAQDVALKRTPTYKWKYQKSEKKIPGNNSTILLEKDIDLSQNVTCVVSVYDANSSSSILLKDCIPAGQLNILRCGRSQDCEDRTGADGTPPEQQPLQAECSGNLEENNTEGSLKEEGNRCAVQRRPGPKEGFGASVSTTAVFLNPGTSSEGGTGQASATALLGKDASQEKDSDSGA